MDCVEDTAKPNRLERNNEFVIHVEEELMMDVPKTYCSDGFILENGTCLGRSFIYLTE